MDGTLSLGNTPFTPAQQAWLAGFFAGLLSGGASVGAGDGSTSTATRAPTAVAEPEEFPWHDPSLDIDERLRLAEGKPLPRRLMAAMAQLDCGACGYQCQTYAEAIA